MAILHFDYSVDDDTLYVEQGEESCSAGLEDAEGELTCSQPTNPYFISSYIENNPDRVVIELSSSAPVGTSDTISVSDGTTTLYLTIEVVEASVTPPGPTPGSTVYAIDNVSESSITFQPEDGGDSVTITFDVVESTDGGSTYHQSSATPQDAGVSASLDDPSDHYITIFSTNFSEQGSGSVTIQYYNTYQNTGPEDHSVELTIAVSTGDNCYIPITVYHNYYVYKLEIDSYSGSTSVGASVSSSDFTVYKYQKLATDTSWTKESDSNVSSQCSWSPSLSYNASSAGSVTFEASMSGYDSGTYTVTFTSAAYITLDGESSYEETLNRIGSETGEGTNVVLSVDTNLSTWGVNASTNASTVSSYGISVSKSGSDEVTVSGTSTYGGQNGDSITGIWIVGTSSTYATVEITLTYENEQPVVTTYTYRINFSPSSLTYSNDDFSSRRIFFDIERCANGTSNWVSYDTDAVTAIAPNGFSISVDNQSLSGHHGYADVTRSYNGQSLYETSISFDTGGENPATGEVEITVNAYVPEVEYEYQTIFVSIDNPDTITGTKTVGETFTYSTSTPISTTYYTQYQKRVKNSGDSWENEGSQEEHSVNAYLNSAFSKTESTAGTYTYTATATASCGTYGNKSVTVSFSITFDDGEPPTYSIRIASPSNNAYVYQSSSGHSLYQPLASSDFTIYLTTDGTEGNTNIASNCNFSYRDSGGGSGDGFPSRNNTSEDIDYTIYAYWNSDHTVWDSIDVTYEAYQEQSEYNLVCTNPSSSSITLPYGSSVSKSDFTFKLTYGGSDVETGISGNSNSLSWSGNGPSLPWTNNYSYSGSHNYSVTYDNYSASTTVTIFFEPEDTPQQDTYSLSVSPTSVTLNSSNSYSSSVTADTYTNNVRTNWGSSLSFSDVDTSKITVTKGSYNSGSGTLFTISKASSCNSSTTTSFTISGHGQSATVSVTITIPPPQATISWRATDDTTILNVKYFYYDFTPSSSPKGILTFSNSYAEEGQHVLFSNYGWVAIKNNNTTSQTRTTIVTVAHGSNSNVTSQLTVTLPPPGFSINVPYWYNNPRAYSGYGYGHVVVSGARNESFTLTLDNTNAGDGFTYSFSSSSVVTTYSGNTGSSGSVEVATYEITKNQNTEDDYGYAIITAVGTPNTRTDTVTIHRVYIPTELSITANPTSFTSAGGSCVLSLYSTGYDNASFEIIGYSDTAAMIQNYTSYVDGTRRSTLSINILENTSTSNRKVTINCLMRGTKEGDDYESEITRTVTLTQSGRGLEEKIILTPSALTFQPTDNGNSKKQQVIVNSGDYNWTVSSDKTWWDYDVISGTSGSAIYIWPTSEAPADTTRSGSITFTSTGSSNITGTLTILQTANSRILGFGHVTDTTQGWDIADADFTGVSTQATGGWTYDSSTRTLTINIPAESTRQDLTVRAVYKVISRFIGWDMTIQGEQPDWISVSPTKLLYNESSTNSIATSINVIADDYNYQADPSCYDVPRSATYVINSNLKKN